MTRPDSSRKEFRGILELPDGSELHSMVVVTFEENRFHGKDISDKGEKFLIGLIDENQVLSGISEDSEGVTGKFELHETVRGYEGFYKESLNDNQIQRSKYRWLVKE